ncbi:hypothetical protein TNCV_2415161 [Trichonephila clavipes]|nr:hypothetical protein TNCV_2415161 [Trichonephila clavipes]
MKWGVVQIIHTGTIIAASLDTIAQQHVATGSPNYKTEYRHRSKCTWNACLRYRRTGPAHDVMLWAAIECTTHATLVCVVGRLESGQTQRSVADAVGVARSVVARLWNRFQETGNVRRRPGAGRPRATISTDDRYIQLTARRNRTENATQLQIHLLLATG